MNQNKTTKYLKYAIGEILLVVIGILIALQINNLNEQRKQENELTKIHERIILDLENDIDELSRILAFWKTKEPIFKKVINDSITPELMDQGLSRLLTSNPQTNLNKTGVLQLKDLNNKEELSLEIIEIYDYMENIHILPFEDQLQERSTSLVNIIQDNYDWFPEWMSKTIMKDNSTAALQNYFLSSNEYRNQVIRFNQIIFNNYVPNLEFFIPLLHGIRNKLKAKSDGSFEVLGKEELQQYAGKYRTITIEGVKFDFEIGDVFNIEALDHVLRLTEISTPDDFTDYLYDGEDTFSNEIGIYAITGVFDRDSSGKVIGMEATIESRQGDKCILYMSKL